MVFGDWICWKVRSRRWEKGGLRPPTAGLTGVGRSEDALISVCRVVGRRVWERGCGMPEMGLGATGELGGR